MFKFNLPESKFDSQVTKIDKWYDRHTKTWVIQLKNKNGHQVGDAIYSDKKGIEIEYERLKEKYSL